MYLKSLNFLYDQIYLVKKGVRMFLWTISDDNLTCNPLVINSLVSSLFAYF